MNSETVTLLNFGGSAINSLTKSSDRDSLLNNRYRIIGQLGRGGFSAVYKAADTLLGDRLVAVKEMRQDGLTAAQITTAVESFKCEALMLAKLIHPNIPRVYDHFSHRGRWYLVMDFIEGETLEHYLNRISGKHLKVNKVLDVGIQLCTVLDYLHKYQPPIIFRDLKPSNVMLTSDGHVYLIDFGIARHFKPGQAKDTVAFGSVGYAAPEQYGKVQTTPRSDIYSLGALLHQLFTGDDPSLTPFRFAPLQLWSISTSVELEALIRQMVDMEPSKRPASMAAVRQELQHIANQQLPDSLSTKTLCIYHGHIAEVNAVAWSPDGKQITSIGYDGTMQVWNAATGDTLFTYTGPADYMYAIAWFPDGKHVASASRDKTVHVWRSIPVQPQASTQPLRRSSGGKFLTYIGHVDYVYALTWSPDGKYIASGGKDKTVQVWDAITRQKIFTYPGHSELVWAAAWSPDGTRIASGSWDSTVQLWKWNGVTNGNTLIYRGHSASVRAVAWSPDSTRITSGSEDSMVQVWGAATGDTLFSYRGHSHHINAVAWSPDGKLIASTSEEVHVLDAETGEVICIYSGHSGAVNAVAWSLDSFCIASASHDKTVQIWRPT